MGECSLFQGLFGVAVQVILFLISFGVLVAKKFWQKNDRTWSVFMLDSSKQVIGAGFVHMLNLLLSTILGNELEGDPCDWYWMHIMVDTTLGVFLEYLWLMALIKLLVRVTGDSKSFRFGEYTDAAGSVNQIVYVKQLVVWLCCIIGMKMIVVAILFELLNEFIFVTRIILAPVSWNAQLKLTFVMVLTPCCMNAVQFWLTDNFLQKGGVSLRQVAHGCTGCCSSVYYLITGKRKERRPPADGGKRKASVTNLERLATFTRLQEQEEDDIENDSADSPNGDLLEPLLVDPRNSLNPFDRRPSMNSQDSRSGIRQEALDELSVNAPGDTFEGQRAAYQASLEQLRHKISQLESVSAQERREKESAEVQARLNQEQMLDQKEQLHKVQQDVRMHTYEKELLRDRLAVKEEKERQLMVRIQQLEFSYSTAGATANAVFAAEVSAASVAAASAAGRHQESPSIVGVRHPQGLGAYEDFDDKSTIADFLASSVAKGLSPASSARPGGISSPFPSNGASSSTRLDPRKLADAMSEIENNRPQRRNGGITAG